jgi:hypothetical protein
MRILDLKKGMCFKFLVGDKVRYIGRVKKVGSVGRGRLLGFKVNQVYEVVGIDDELGKYAMQLLVFSLDERYPSSVLAYSGCFQLVERGGKRVKGGGMFI